MTGALKWLLSGLVAATFAVAPARAEFDDPGFELHDVSAWTLRGGELELSPEAIRIGLFDVFEVGSAYALDLLGAINAELKATLHAGRFIAVGARAGFVYFDPGFVGVDTDFKLAAFPVAFEVSARPIEAVRVHGGVEFLSARPENRAPDVALRLQRHLGSVGRLVLALGGEYRFNNHLDVLARVELPLLAHRASLRYDDEAGSFGNFVRVQAALQLVYASFNLRVGVGYGPSFLGRSGVFPVLDLAFRVF